MPHQISAVYGEMLHRLPLRYILADDPGAGKTIMTGLLLKELMIRGDLKRCLIVSPGSLSEQWQDELYSKFHLKFEILTNDRIESAVGGNVFAETNLCIARLDKLSRNDVLQDKLQPYFIEAFFVEAFTRVGGKIHRREHGRYEITSVPFAVRNRDMQIGFGESVLSRYERMIEIPPRFAGIAPVNPEARSQSTAGEKMMGAAGLAEDVSYYGQWMKQRAFERIGHLYPKVKVPQEQGGGEATVIAWIWSRTVKCPNPACGCEMPLVRSFNYGMDCFSSLFTNRQLVALTSFCDLVKEAQAQVEADAEIAGMPNSHISLANGGCDARAYSEAVGVYLGFGVCRMADIDNAFCSWEVTKTQVRHLFTRQAIPMLWDFGENNVFNNAAGDYCTSLGSIVRVIERFQNTIPGFAKQQDAQSDCGYSGIMISTDPPYYDNIGYADLSDFFYIWMRKVLRNTYPDLFSTVLVPKAEELVATPYRFDGNAESAKAFFEDGMLKSCQQLYKYTDSKIPVTIYRSQSTCLFLCSAVWAPLSRLCYHLSARFALYHFCHFHILPSMCSQWTRTAHTLEYNLDMFIIKHI